MAQEKALGSARALEQRDQELSKEELQRRMEEARDSISNTVTEIKETVAQQVQTVKDTLDWREQYRKRPVVWSLGAMGAGFFLGCRIAAAMKGEEEEGDEYVSSVGHAYAGQPILGESRSSPLETEDRSNGKADEGPGLFQRFKETPAFDRLRNEVATIGDRFVEELSLTAQTVVLPLLIRKIKNLIGVDLSDEGASQRVTSSQRSQTGTGRSEYQPVHERPS